MLPEYTNEATPWVVHEDDVLPQTTLYAAGRFIQSADPRELPLYELSHSIGFLKDADRSVRIERLEHTVKSPASTDISTRKRHIYDLKHPTRATGPTFKFHAEPTSRQSLCTFGLMSFRLKKFSSVKGWRVHRATHSPDHRLLCQGLLFSVVPSRDERVKYYWRDTEGNLVAHELDDSGIMTLGITAKMRVDRRDALVSAWVSRIWWTLAKTGRKDSSSKDDVP